MSAAPVTTALTVAEELAGIQLQDFLARIYPQTDRSRLRGLQARGQVRRNGMVVDRNCRLAAFDLVELVGAEDELRPRVGKPVTVALEVLFTSATTVVVDKPPGLLTVPERNGEGDSVHRRLGELRPHGDLRIVHRLDRGTSGCLILGDGLAAARHFDAAFRTQQVHKEYIALVQGMVAPTVRSIDLFLGSDPRRAGKVMATANAKKGFRAASTQIVAAVPLGRLTLVRLHPQTGRTHQLRAHLAAVGHPIVGDIDYGGEPLLLSAHKRGYKLRRGVRERPLLERMFLHCERLEFVDVDGRRVDVRAPLPADLATALRRLGWRGGLAEVAATGDGG